MRKSITFLSLAALLPLHAQTFKEWQDEKVNEVNRLPMRAAFFPYSNEDAALSDNPKNQKNYLSLNGDWKFNWVANADQRPTDFYKTGYNDKGWDVMPVPGMWELNGYGDPLDVHTGYAWRNDFVSNPPIVPTDKNHVGSYRKDIQLTLNMTRSVNIHLNSAKGGISLRRS